MRRESELPSQGNARNTPLPQRSPLGGTRALAVLPSETARAAEPRATSEHSSASPPLDPRRERIAWLRHLIVERFGPHVLLEWRRPTLAAAPTTSDVPFASTPDHRTIPTSLLGLDLALGGGLPRGRLVELAGPPYSGKRTLAAWFVRAAQRSGGWVAYLDAAHGVDFDRLHRWGIAVLDLLVALPQTPSEALELARLLVLAGALDLIVLDLPPQWTSRSELVRGLRQLRPLLRGTPTVVLVVRDRTHEPPLATAPVRLRVEPLAQLQRPGPLATSTLPPGLRVRLHLERSPFGPPRELPVPLELSEPEGVRAAIERVDLALATGVLVPHPLGLVFADTVLGRTREAAARRLAEDPALGVRLEAAIQAHWSTLVR